MEERENEIAIENDRYVVSVSVMYICLKHQVLKSPSGYSIVPIRQEDVECIRLWRNAQMDVLRQQTIITFEQQVDYYRQMIAPTFSQLQPIQILFSFLFHGKCIGYGGLTHIDWHSGCAELSFLLEPTRTENDEVYTQDFTQFFALLAQVAFVDLGLHRLYSETYSFRTVQIAAAEKLGFVREGILREHVYKKQQWIDAVRHGLLASEWEQATESTCDRKIKELRILITSISKKTPLIEAVRNAARKMGHSCTVYGCDSDDSCIGRYFVDVFWHSPRLEQLMIADIIDYCLQNHIRIIIPTRDSDLLFYALHASDLKRHGIFVMCSPLETILLCMDKKKFADTFSIDFPVISTYTSIDELHFSKYVVKERKGAGSRQIGLKLNREEAMKWSPVLKEPIYQAYVEGTEWSIDLYRSWMGEIQGCVARRRDVVQHGESQVTTTMQYPRLESLCIRMADQLNIQGPAVFQVIESSNGEFSIIECNPRFGGASTASIYVGLDVFFWFFLECLGLELKEHPFVRLDKEVRQIRYMTDRIIAWS